MDWLTTLPPIVAVIGNLAAWALQALAERLLTIMLAILIVGSVSLFAVTAFAWLWLKRAIVDWHPQSGTLPR